MKKPTVVFHNVLYVLQLASNILFLLYLSIQKDYVIDIWFRTVYFYRQGSLLFTASINKQNIGYLDGFTVESSSEVANATSIQWVKKPSTYFDFL